jgi:transcriptional regulator
MYVPAAFRVDDLPTLHGMMRSTGLANLVTATPEGLTATPLPLMLEPNEGEFGTLYGHLARANPHWKLSSVGESLVIFAGPDAYVSPSWYPSKQEHGKVVPTWNYVAVHAYGEAEFFEEPDRLLALVTRLTDLHEGKRDKPWAVSDAPESFVRSQLRAIVGLRLPITRIEGKKKLSQNRSEADRAGVVEGLKAVARGAPTAVAALMDH